MKVLTATRLGAIGVLLSSAALADGHFDGMSPQELLPLVQAEGSVTVRAGN